MLRGGPRLTEGTVDRLPEASASIRHKLQSGELSLAYASVLTTVFGLTNSVKSQSITATATTELLSRLRLSVVPPFTRISSDIIKPRVYALTLKTPYQLQK